MAFLLTLNDLIAFFIPFDSYSSHQRATAAILISDGYTILSVFFFKRILRRIVSLGEKGRNTQNKYMFVCMYCIVYELQTQEHPKTASNTFKHV